MILIIGDLNDPVASYLAWLAEQRDLEVMGLDESLFGLDWHIDAASPPQHVELRGRRVALSDVSGVVLRLAESPRVDHRLGIPGVAHAFYAAQRRRTVEALVATAALRVVNPVAAHRPVEPATCDASRLSAAGFQVPEWLLTADPDEALAFALDHGQNVVVKSIDGRRRFVGWWTSDTTEQLSGAVPVLLQQYVAGDDVRVHVVGDRVFATMLQSDPFGDPLDGGDRRCVEIETPRTIRQLCLILARCEGLPLAAFHFKVTIDGTWWCLRMSDEPTFVELELDSGQRIGDAVLDLFGVVTPASELRRDERSLV